MNTTLILACGVDGCTSLVTAEYEPPERMTRDFPGYPGYWYAFKHDDNFAPKIGDSDHIDKLADSDDFHVRCDQIASQSFDNDVWDY